MKERTARPSAVSRFLRQEAGYGCCVCGHPIFQYHHIIPYTEKDPHYRPEDMMVLCLNHHDQATQGVLSETNQRESKSRPFNIVNGFAQGQLTIKQEDCLVLIGQGSSMKAEGSIFEIDNEPLLFLRRSSEGTLLFGARLYDKEDNLLVTIEDNVWEATESLPWDIEYSYRKLTVRSESRQIALTLDARKSPISLTGKLWKHGKHISLEKQGIALSNGSGIFNIGLEGLAVRSNTDGGFELGPPRPAPVQKQPKLGRNEPCWCSSGKKFKKCHGR